MTQQEHEIDAFFSSDGNQYKPVLSCSCGFSSGRCDTWEQAGAQLDEHIDIIQAEARPRQQP